MQWMILGLKDMDSWLGWAVSVAVACGIHGIAQFFSVLLLVPPHKQEKDREGFPQPFRFIDPLGIPMFLLTGWAWTRPYPLPNITFERPFFYTVLFYIAGSVGNVALAGIISTLYVLLLPSTVFNLAMKINLYVAVANITIPLPPFSLGRGIFAGLQYGFGRRAELTTMVLFTFYTLWCYKVGSYFVFEYVWKVGNYLLGILIG